jgi:hypothetical protein
MSRTIKLRVAKSIVVDLCRAQGVAYFSTETLPCGGTRIFCKTDDGADEVRLRFRDHMLDE